MCEVRHLTNSEERDAYAELEETLARNAPSAGELEKTLDTLSGGVELSDDERNNLIRDIERVWHIMRLMKLMAEYFGGRVCFGGGAVVNYIYMPEVGEAPRFTFDLDGAWRLPARAKRDILTHIPLFNRWLAERGYSFRIPVGGGRYARLWLVEYDVEKDHFPDVLSLRVPVLTRYTGEPFHRFLGIQDYGTTSKLRGVFRRVLDVRDPLVDYVRFEISLGMQNAPVVEVDTVGLFGSRVRALVTEPELQLAWKILGKLGRHHENIDAELHDMLKVALDLRLLKHLDRGRVREYVVRAEKPEVVLASVEMNLSALREKAGPLWGGHHYVLVRKRKQLGEVVDGAWESIRNLF